MPSSPCRASAAALVSGAVIAPLLAIAVSWPLAASAQIVADTVPTAPAASASTATSPPAHDMSSHQHRHDPVPEGGPVQAGEGALSMRSAFGPYPMSRNGSGTSWQPDATPFDGLHFAPGDWQVMAQAFVNAIYDRQTGPRGGDKLFTESMAMLMADRPLGPGTLGLHAMLSLDPAMGKSGYPLLGQSGETADGATPLIDRQHPHDFFMELAASYSVRLGDSGAAFVYLGLPGEPALGPTVFMHRFSAMRNPEAPLTHHWLDSTHIVFGVATLGVSQGPLQLEASWFNGREPDPYRWNIETRGFDSWSTRLSYNPVPELSLQVSYGDLKSPEQLEPEMRVRRTTASIIYQRRLGAGNWGTTFAYGLNRKSDRTTSASEPGWLLESTYVLGDTHTFFGRAEQVTNDELLAHGDPLHGQQFRVRKLTLGYIHDFARTGPVKWGIGGLVGLVDVPARLDPVYGSRPRSYLLFLQARL